MKKDCAFQYYDGTKVKVDETELTIEEAKELWNENYDDMVEKAKDDNNIEVAIWINMNDKYDYRDKLIYLSNPNVDEYGGLWEKKFYGKL